MIHFMAGLNHDGFLVSRSAYPYSAYAAFLTDPSGIQLHDDLIWYVNDTLQWIPTFNPARDEPWSGLCHYGPTIISSEGAARAQGIFASWAAVFSNGPATLSLRGHWTRIDGDARNGAYDTIEVQRDELVEKLHLRTTYAQDVVQSNGALYILHLGI